MSTKTKSKPGDDQSRQPPTKSTPLPGVPRDVAEFIGGRPIVKGEDATQYDALFGKLTGLITPDDPMEWIWAKDVADAHWEAQRARRLRDQILDLGRFKAMRLVAENLLQDKRLEGGFRDLITETVSSWTGADGEAKLAEFLARYDLDPRAIAAEVFMNRSEVYDQLDRIAAAADKRRDAVFREIERRRAWRAPNFREASKIVDAEAEEVTGKEPSLPTVQHSSRSNGER